MKDYDRKLQRGKDWLRRWLGRAQIWNAWAERLGDDEGHRGKKNVWKSYKGKQMEMIWWETEVHEIEESTGQGCVREQRGIQAGWHVKREGEFSDTQSTMGRLAPTGVSMRNWKGKNENENTEPEFSRTWRKQLFRVLLVSFLTAFVPFYIELFWEMGISISM